MKSLDEIQNYKNENVILRFMQILESSREEAEFIFEQLKKWLWLCAKAQQDRKENPDETPESLVVDHALLIIDEMWHNFICFTKDYQEFCNEYLGTFVHHFPMPTGPNQKEKLDIQQEKKKRELQYSYIYDELGADTLELWYDIFPDQYSAEYILQHRLE